MPTSRHPSTVGNWCFSFEVWAILRKGTLSKRKLHRGTMSARGRAKSAMPVFTSVGRRRLWRMWCDPREHPDAIIPDLATNTVARFTKAQVDLVYGSLWKQRYFTKIGDDYFPLPAQWVVGTREWRPYLVPKTADWWTAFYPPDNMQRPTGPTCDGCHSVGYDIRTKRVAEWNVACERCHGPGSEHVTHPARGYILNPAQMDSGSTTDICIHPALVRQC